MTLLENELYLRELNRLIEAFPDWSALDGKTVFLSGASGMIGSCLVDAILLRNTRQPAEKRCRVIGACRNRTAAEKRFAAWTEQDGLYLLPCDMCDPLPPLPCEPDFWIHAASTTHPVAYASEPIATIMTNVQGTANLLSALRPGNRFLLLSSVEIYGENRGDVERFTEDYCGYIDCNTLRAGYPEAKRVSEALCQAYIRQNGADAVILRLPRCYGPTMQMSDTKAIAQFIKKAVAGEDIVLKSEGNQRYSFAHAADAALGILFVLTNGQTGEAYNLSDSESDITLKELAFTAAQHAGMRVLFEIPDETEKMGYSKASKALLNAGKLRALGWQASYQIRSGLSETIDIIRQLRES